MLRSVKMKLTVIVTVLVVTAGSAFALLGLGKYETVKPANGTITVPMARVSDGKAHFFKVPTDGKDIAFFLVKAKDGAIRSSFDACDVCYREKKGYEQKGDDMICKNCNKRFATDRIGPHAAGGCNPSYFPHTEVGGNVVIRVEDLRAGTRFF